jgi:Family of unknown function (DUF6675)
MTRFVFSAVLLCQVSGLAQSRPQPPCGEGSRPLYPALDQSPAVKFWSDAGFGRDWIPPPCTGWTAPGFSTLITIAARFHCTAGSGGLLRRVGAISELAGMRYWSTTHQKWQTLIEDAHALTGPKQGRRRQDFPPDELKDGTVFYLEQSDNLSGSAIYRMHIGHASEDRLVFDIENVSVMRYLFVTLFHPGEMQSIYFLDRESEGVWRCYSMVRTGRNASRLATGHEASSINRAVAFFRYLAGIPTAQEPPAAR